MTVQSCVERNITHHTNVGHSIISSLNFVAIHLRLNRTVVLNTSLHCKLTYHPEQQPSPQGNILPRSHWAPHNGSGPSTSPTSMGIKQSLLLEQVYEQVWCGETQCYEGCRKVDNEPLETVGNLVTPLRCKLQ